MMTLRFCDVYVDEELVGHCELKTDAIKIGNEIYITGESSNFIIDSFEETEDTLRLECARVFTSDISAVIQHDTSFCALFDEDSQDGISPQEAQQIIRLLTSLGFQALKVYCLDNKIITYHIIDSDKVMVDYFYSPSDVIEWLQK